MTDKTRLTRLINERLLALQRSAAWLAQALHTSETDISLWLDATQPAMPRDPQIVRTLAAALAMDQAQTLDLFAAAGLAAQPTPAAQPHIEATVKANTIAPGGTAVGLQGQTVHAANIAARLQANQVGQQVGIQYVFNLPPRPPQPGQPHYIKRGLTFWQE